MLHPLALALFALPAFATSGPSLRPTDGGLPKEAIDKAIRAHMPAIAQCYTDEQARKNLGAETVKTKFVVGPEGKVLSADAIASSGNHRLENCLEQELRTLQFPKPIGGGTVEVAYPFSFSPTDPAAAARPSKRK